MLSTKQKQLRDLSKGGSSAQVREASSDYDLDRVIELWSNLVAVQQMQGHRHWLDQAEAAKLKWRDFARQIILSDKSKVAVFDDQDKIFGFAYMQVEKSKATVEEIYLEPSHRSQIDNNTMAEILRACMKAMGIKFVRFAVKDLPNDL
jgi:hypothetical protein